MKQVQAKNITPKDGLNRLKGKHCRLDQKNSAPSNYLDSNLRGYADF